MCIAVASKIKLANTEKENWFLFKVRDRTYTPEYKITYIDEDGVQAVFLTDKQNDWSEGVNSKGIMLVSTTLQNHDDKKDDGSGGTGTGKRKVDLINHKMPGIGPLLRDVFKMDKIEDVVKTLEDKRFEGCTLVSDGKRLFVIEIFLDKVIKEKYEQIILKKRPELADKEDPKKRMELRDIIYSMVNKEEFKVEVREINKKENIVRTNHGVFLKDSGYTPKDGDGYKSSILRREYVQKTLDGMDINHPFDVLTAIKNMKSPRVHENPEMRPIRIPPSKYITTTVLMLTPTGTMFAIPMEAKFENIDINKLNQDKGVNFVLLPKGLRLFESTYKYFSNKIINKFNNILGE